jgi:hypothetical protein
MSLFTLFICGLDFLFQVLVQQQKWFKGRLKAAGSVLALIGAMCRNMALFATAGSVKMTSVRAAGKGLG